MIDSLEPARQALDDLLTREGPAASLVPLFDFVEEEEMELSKPEAQEEEASSGTPVSIAGSLRQCFDGAHRMVELSGNVITIEESRAKTMYVGDARTIYGGIENRVRLELNW